MAAAPTRATWTGTLSFGLVTIPVKLYTATETHDISFRQVHEEDAGPITYRRVCSCCAKEVPYADIAKGYEFDERMVVLGDNDLANLPLPAKQILEVTQFTDASEIDPMMFDKSYYVLPVKAGTNAFALLSEAMRSTGLAGIVKIAIRQRESLGLLQLGENGAMTLITLLWPDEVRDAPKPEQPQLNSALITHAVQLMTAMAAPFEPGEHTDEYATAVRTVVENKINGITPAAAPAAPASAGGPVDLSDILKASVAAARAPKASRNVKKART